MSIDDPAINRIETHAWLKDADSWATWVPYQSAFTFLAIGWVSYAYALLAAASLAHGIPIWLLWCVIVSTVLIQAGRLAILHHRKYKYDDNPIRRFFRQLKTKHKKPGKSAPSLSL